MIFWGVWFLVENSAQLWSTSPKKKATQQFRGSLPPSCCAEEKTAENARSFQQQWGGTSRRNFRAISSNHPRANVFPLLDMETCKLGRGYVGLQDGMLFMRYKQEIEYNICNYKYYIYIYTYSPRLSTLWMVISGCNPLCILGFPDCQFGMWSTSIGLPLQMLMIFTYGIKFSHIEEAGWWKEAPLSNSKKKAMEIKNWFDSRVFWLRIRGWSLLLHGRVFSVCWCCHF